MRRPALIPVLLLAAAALVFAVGTRRDLREPHLRIFSDMVRSPASKSQSANPILPGGRTQQAPPPHTLARGEEAEEGAPAKGGKNPVAPSFEAMQRGRFVFENYCSHCHGLKGAGDGAVSKAFPGFSYPINGKSTYDLSDAVLFKVVSEGRNNMPSHRAQLRAEDRWKAVLYVRDLERQELARLGPLAVVPEDPRRHVLVSADYGRELFSENCAACHGAEGLHPKPGIPTLHAPAVLAIAPDSYYWDIINHGRSGTQMPAWKEVLTKTQIESLVAYIRTWASPVPETGLIVSAKGDAAGGSRLFAARCAGCHGADGSGGVGNSLNAPSFLAIASEPFLRETIALGRRHTAMPSTYEFKAQDVADLVAYIRSWAKPAQSFEEVQSRLASASVQQGRKTFAARCAACHGDKGEGGLGSELADDAFLSMADDRFLYDVIVRGRPGTAMPGWHFLSADETAGLIAYLRTWQKSPSVAGSTWTASGRSEFGEVLFKQECAKCHGPAGEGDLGTQIGNPVFLGQVSDDFLRRTIYYGKAGTEMKGFGNRARSPLSEADIGHLIAYLRRLQRTAPPRLLHNTFSWASAKAGKDVYEKKADCAKCHGPQGEGGSGPALGNPAFLSVATNGFLTATIIMGREGTEMKSYAHGPGAKLEQEDIENVVAYLRGFAKTPLTAQREVPRSPEAARAGAELFRSSCARCHGNDGRGLHGDLPGQFGPALNNREFLKAADDNFLLATIALGRPGTPMPAFGRKGEGYESLSAVQMRQIVAYLRSWEKKRG